jgi:hypothetical protein
VIVPSRENRHFSNLSDYVLISPHLREELPSANEFALQPWRHSYLVSKTKTAPCLLDLCVPAVRFGPLLPDNK